MIMGWTADRRGGLRGPGTAGQKNEKDPPPRERDQKKMFSQQSQHIMCHKFEFGMDKQILLQEGAGRQRQSLGVCLSGRNGLLLPLDVRGTRAFGSDCLEAGGGPSETKTFRRQLYLKGPMMVFEFYHDANYGKRHF